jgi:hypothetical protein
VYCRINKDSSKPSFVELQGSSGNKIISIALLDQKVCLSIKEELTEYLVNDHKKEAKKTPKEPIMQIATNWFVEEFYPTINSRLKYQWSASDSAALKQLIGKCRKQIEGDFDNEDLFGVLKNFFFLTGKYAKSQSDFNSNRINSNFNVRTINSLFNELWSVIGRKLAENDETKAKLASFIRG